MEENKNLNDNKLELKESNGNKFVPSYEKKKREDVIPNGNKKLFKSKISWIILGIVIIFLIILIVIALRGNKMAYSQYDTLMQKYRI